MVNYAVLIAVLIEWTNMLPPLCMHTLQQGHFIELKQGCAGLPSNVNKVVEKGKSQYPSILLYRSRHGTSTFEIDKCQILLVS